MAIDNKSYFLVRGYATPISHQKYFRANLLPLVILSETQCSEVSTLVNRAIQRGVTLTDALTDTKYFDPMALQMINTGEQSGELDKMLTSVAEYYKIKYDYILDNMSAYIEPIMTFFLACLVLLLALGIFLPMWGLGAAAKG